MCVCVWGGLTPNISPLLSAIKILPHVNSSGASRPLIQPKRCLLNGQREQKQDPIAHHFPTSQAGESRFLEVSLQGCSKDSDQSWSL